MILDSIEINKTIYNVEFPSCTALCRMSDSRRIAGDGTPQPKTKSKPQRSFFEKVDEQFEILYQSAVEKANVQTSNTAGEQTYSDQNKRSGLLKLQVPCWIIHRGICLFVCFCLIVQDLSWETVVSVLVHCLALIKFYVFYISQSFVISSLSFGILALTA